MESQMSDHGTFHWNELLTGDVEKAKTFFSATVGWTYHAFPMSDRTYWVAMVGDKPIGGIMEMPAGLPEGTPPHWMSYMAVDDVDARVAQVGAAGGEVLQEPFSVESVGRIAIIRDPSGAVLGWITPAAHG